MLAKRSSRISKHTRSHQYQLLLIPLKPSLYVELLEYA